MQAPCWGGEYPCPISRRRGVEYPGAMGEEGGGKSIQVPCPQGEEVGYPGPMTRGGIGYGGSGGIVDHHVISNGPWSDTCL